MVTDTYKMTFPREMSDDQRKFVIEMLETTIPLKRPVNTEVIPNAIPCLSPVLEGN